MNEKDVLIPKAEAAQLVAKANLLAGLGRALFFLLCLLSILGFAFAVTYYDKEGGKTVALIGLIAGCVLLVGAALSAALLFRAASRVKAVAVAAVDALYDGEDGLSKEFCLSIRGETVETLQLILADQKEDYSPEEYAFIEKVYEEKIK